MGEHYEKIPQETFKTQMLVRPDLQVQFLCSSDRTHEMISGFPPNLIRFPTSSIGAHHSLAATVFLGLGPSLPVHPRPHQDLHHSSISSSLPHVQHATRLQHPSRVSLCLWSLGSGQCLGHVCSTSQVLGSYRARILLRQKRALVLQFSPSHSDRLPDPGMAHAGAQVVAAA